LRVLSRTEVPASGNVLTEYGLILGLVVLLGVAGLQVTGGSVSSLLGGFDRNESSVSRLVSLKFGNSNTATAGQSITSGPVTLNGAGYYTFEIDPATGLPTLKLTDSNTGAVSNATSVDGKQWNILGQFHLADSLDKLAAAETDPATSAYLKQLADISYYLAAAEGEADGIPGLELGDNYGKLQAAQDIIQYQSQLTQLISNPPAGMDRATLTQAMALTADVYNIAQGYNVAMSPLLKSGAPQDFVYTWTNTGLGNGQPGAAMGATAADVTYWPPDHASSVGNMTIEQVFTIQQIQGLAQDILSGHQVSTEPVRATMTDATLLEQASTGAAPTVAP
jgi:Flp pilus assembly pilin Flp